MRNTDLTKGRNHMHRIVTAPQTTTTTTTTTIQTMIKEENPCGRNTVDSVKGMDITCPSAAFWVKISAASADVLVTNRTHAIKIIIQDSLLMLSARLVPIITKVT